MIYLRQIGSSISPRKFVGYSSKQAAIDDTNSSIQAEVFEGEFVSCGVFKRQLVAASLEPSKLAIESVENESEDEDQF